MSTVYQYYPCNPDFYDIYPQNQGRGVTGWNLNNQTILNEIPPNQSKTITFTCTVPKCYSAYNPVVENGSTIDKLGRDSCNIVFNAYTKQSTPGTVALEFILNNQPLSKCFLSGKTSQHGGTQTFELANTSGSIYNDMGINTFVLHNTLSATTIQVDDLRIYRTYKLCNINACTAGSCPTCYGDTILCHGGSITGTGGNLDYTRVDTPCNCAACGGLSFTQVHDSSKEGSIIPTGGSFSWTFQFSTISEDNYVGKSICLFNFNQVKPNTTDNNTDHDVKLVANLNGTSITTYYLNRWQDGGFFPSYDLATSPLYNDTGYNTVTLINNGSVDVRMLEAIDIYRIYQSEPVPDCDSCGTGCEVSCQTACATSCQTACAVGCQTGCEVSCQTTCQVSCQYCNTCQTQCQTSCQVCQSACEYSCQDCQTTCELICQDCQTTCEVSCQTACQASCQDCQTTCETICEDCQFCVTCVANQACTPPYYTCQSCIACMPCYSAQE
jgi:hypothetical protein